MAERISRLNKRHSPVFNATLFQHFCQFIQTSQRIGNVMLLRLIVDDKLGLFVCHRLFRFDNAFVEFRGQYISILVDFPYAGEGKTFLVAAQRAQIRAEQLWHHVDSFVDQIHCGGARCSFLVQRITRPNEMADVGDVNADLVIARFNFATMQCVVDIRATRRIHRAYGDVT